MSSVPRLRPVNNWPEATIGGNTFSARSYEREDGFRIVHFADPNGEQSLVGTSEQGKTRVAYRVFDEEALFLGVYMGREHRDHGISEGVVNYFIDTVGKVEGNFCGTGKINKPLIALLMNRVGLSPVSSDFRVEVLPRSTYDQSHTPKVEVLLDAQGLGESMRMGPNGPFYEVVPHYDVVRHFPVNTGDKIVDIHTEYEPV